MDAQRAGSRLWPFLVAGVLLGLTAFRLIYLAIWCPLDLAPDEAHYWDWSRNLDWSYYSKGPLVAWVIRGSCELFGPLSIQLTGTEVLAVRLPAVLCGSLLLWSLYLLTVLSYGRRDWGFLVVVVGATWPATTAASLIMTIDSPFLCCWGWSLVFGYFALVRERSWAWIPAGLCIALGILAKYTMALWLFSAGLFLLFTPTHRRMLMRPGFWIMSLVAGLSALPILYWNWQNDWVTFRHVATQAGVEGKAGGGVRWLGPLEFLSGQFGLLMGYWFVAWVAALLVHRPTRELRPEIRYMWWMSLPTVGLFTLVSFKAGTQINWPVAAYLSGMILALGWIMKQVSDPSPGYRRLARFGCAAIVLLGLCCTVIVHDTRLAHPMLAKIVGPPSEQNPFPLRKVDPTCRLRGWNYLASQVDQIRQVIEANEGGSVEIAGLNWMLPGQLGFYCQGHPTVYSLGLAMGDRHSQYDLWRPNPLADAQAFQGKTFLFVGVGIPPLKDAFASVDAPRRIEFVENGNPIAAWSVWVCRGFKGFPSSSGVGARRD
jgi:4-amino-4-deoxy-L-arabinose transferase-like glycosyltransferase